MALKSPNCPDHGEINIWEKMAPEAKHKYRLKCANCRRFNRWGTEQQLLLHQSIGKVKEIVPYTAPKPAKPLPGFE